MAPEAWEKCSHLRHFGISRSTFTAGIALRSEDPRHWRTLERAKRRKAKLGKVELGAVKRVREQYLVGKDNWRHSWNGKASRLGLDGGTDTLSPQAHSPIVEPLASASALDELDAGAPTHPQARIPAASPGDIIQIDTLDVRPSERRPQAVSASTSSHDTASSHPQPATARSPPRSRYRHRSGSFPIEQSDRQCSDSCRVRGRCRDKQIKLFVLPPRSPKLNGCVERSQRITPGVLELTRLTRFVSLRSSSLSGSTLQLHRPQSLIPHPAQFSPVHQ